MPDFGDGLIAAVGSAIGGFIISICLEAVFSGLEFGGILYALVTVLSVIAIIETLDNMNYWGILYLIGYLGGTVFIGRLFMDTFELALMVTIGVVYLIIKVWNKMS